MLSMGMVSGSPSPSFFKVFFFRLAFPTGTLCPRIFLDIFFILCITCFIPLFYVEVAAVEEWAFQPPLHLNVHGDVLARFLFTISPMFFAGSVSSVMGRRSEGVFGIPVIDIGSCLFFSRLSNGPELSRN